MKAGDVPGSRPTARVDVYDISVVPAVARIGDVRCEDGRETTRVIPTAALSQRRMFLRFTDTFIMTGGASAISLSGGATCGGVGFPTWS